MEEEEEGKQQEGCNSGGKRQRGLHKKSRTRQETRHKRGEAGAEARRRLWISPCNTNGSTSLHAVAIDSNI